ncbi:ABC transporter permease [Streptomyces alfalfae]|uniref:ABC transporter permease n=1 Tax=Streptomyces alfalfae TaxID=1642299 RepID=A0A7T4U170_9ACTN|nr:ABC transporter permease [Streptomyces alfalfae]QQC92177.1 ABC transporter permease [Streptomyces alfalfae]
MTPVAEAAARTSREASPAAQEPRPRFTDLVAAEWLKFRSLRSTAWSLAGAVLAVLAFNAGTAYDTYRYWRENDADGRARFVRDGIALQEAFNGNAMLVMMLAAGAVGALAVAGEHRTGLIRTTFAAVPARRPLLAAKVLVVAAATTALGAAAAGLSFWLTQTILDGRGVGVPLGHPGAWRLVAASALLAPVSALTGMALGALLRHVGAALVAVFVLLLLLPGVLGDDRRWTAVAGHATPYQAWLRLAEAGEATTRYPWTVAGAWATLALWSLAAAVVAVVAVDRRDL